MTTTDRTPTSDDIQAARDAYLDCGPDACVRDLLDGLDAAGQYDDEAAAKAAAVRALFEVRVVQTQRQVEINVGHGPLVLRRAETHTVYGVLDGIAGRLRDAASSRALEEERNPAQLTAVHS